MIEGIQDHTFSPIDIGRDVTSTFPQHARYSTRELVQACARDANWQRSPPSEQDPCYELFCRAFEYPPDQEAWTALMEQYHRLVHYWLGQYASEDLCQQVFLRFWQAQQAKPEPFCARFPNIKAVMGYLRRCAVRERIDAHRREKERRQMIARLEDAVRAELILIRVSAWNSDRVDLKRLVHSRFKNEQERVVFEASYRHGLPPREIQAEYPDLFPDAHTVHRVKENLLKRLRRDPELREWWAG